VLRVTHALGTRGRAEDDFTVADLHGGDDRFRRYATAAATIAFAATLSVCLSLVAMDITVAIPVFNRSGMLRQALESCRRQSLQDFEIVVCDNCSDEDLRPVLAEFVDLKIRFHRHAAAVSPRENFASAAALATGRYLKFLCSDNLLLPDTLEVMSSALRDNPFVAVAVGGYFEFRETTSGVEICSRCAAVPPERGRRLGWLRLDTVACSGFPATMYVADKLRAVGGFNPAVEAIFDWEMYLALVSRYAAVTIDRLVCAVRVHPGQYSHELEFANGARTLRDVIAITTSAANTMYDRFPLPRSQQIYLRHQVFWAGLRNILSKGNRGKNLHVWLQELKRAGMLLSLWFGFPLWAAQKAFEKVERAQRRDLSRKAGVSASLERYVSQLLARDTPASDGSHQ
jgi:glycosyltransferase involved in cell wall biosynthesis